MADGIKTQFIGFDVLAKKLTTLSDPVESGKAMRTAVRQAMNDVKKTAAQLMPQGIDPHRTYKGRLVAPGFARRSLRVISKLDKSKNMAYALLGVRAEAYYAVQYVELGTQKMQAQPWLRPAFLGSTDPTIRMVGQGIFDWIEDLAKRHETGQVRLGKGRGSVSGSARASQLRGGLQ